VQRKPAKLVDEAAETAEAVPPVTKQVIGA
jgi:hypothetical protein